MKSVVAIALAGLFATVSAQGLSDMPNCALPCLLTGLSATTCDTTNFKCACSDTAFVSGSTACIHEACTSDADRQKAIAVASALCESAGVTISVPSSGSSTSAAESSSASATEVVTTTATVESSAAPTTGGSTESFPTMIDTSSAIVSTLTTSSSVVPTGNVTATSSAPPVQSTNAANTLSGMGGAVALGLGLVAAFAV